MITKVLSTLKEYSIYILLVLLAIFYFITKSKNSIKLKELTDKIEDKEIEIKNSKDKYKEIKTKLKKEKDKINNSISKSKEHLKELKKQSGKKDNEIKNTKNEIKDLEDEIEKLEEARENVSSDKKTEAAINYVNDYDFNNS